MKKGFTLIEMAVIIIIIGFLTSIFLFGQDVLDGQKNSEVITELTYFKEAQESFIDQYNFRPGDVPSSILTGNFSDYADDLCSTSSTGNGAWDNEVERDLAWLQLSQARYIRQQIYFDPCSAPAYRDPKTHRPESEPYTGAGYTFLNNVTINHNSTDHRFAYIIRLGKKDNSSDTELSSGALTIRSVRSIDTKIDQPNTPLSGRFFITHPDDIDNCVNIESGNIVYEPEQTEDVYCTGNLAEYGSDELSNAYTP